MITPKEIKSKAERKYTFFLQKIVKNQSFERIEIRADKSYSKSSSQDFEREILEIVSQSKKEKGYGYSLDFKQVRTKSFGIQNLPVAIYFETETDFLKFLGKEIEVAQFKENIQKINSLFPELKDWMLKYPKKIIDYESEWDNLLKVCTYFKQNPKPNIYIRELPINVHTKFVEQHKGILTELLNTILSGYYNTDEKEFEKRFHLKFSEPLVRFKILDPTISKQFFSGIDDLAIPISQFEILNLPVQKVLVVENKTTLYTTLTLPKMEKSIAVFGSGYSVYNLKNASWLDNVELFYWGDIDVQGFEILSQFRGYFPKVKSVLMDIDTFNKFFENELGTPSAITELRHLTNEEKELYNTLKEKNWRLEQEKIPFGYALRVFKKM
ncbi:MAG: DUF2220 family protein [Bacteroidota bacterium]|nr:DUF2220 family protein [Bacteroidota bacterium]